MSVNFGELECSSSALTLALLVPVPVERIKLVQIIFVVYLLNSRENSYSSNSSIIILILLPSLPSIVISSFTITKLLDDYNEKMSHGSKVIISVSFDSGLT